MFVHVGLPKTGTTYVQTMMATNRQKIADQGLLYPRGLRGRQHFLAVLDFMQWPFGGVTLDEVDGLWVDLVDKVLAWPGRSLISHELLSRATSDEVARLVQSFAAREVHAVVGARDLATLVPAVWQERAKNRAVETWSDYREQVALGPDGGHPFWRLHDLEHVLAVWRQHIPDERIHVVTVPPPGADSHLLFDRFAGLLGLHWSNFTMATKGNNISIGVTELALLREVNVAADDRLDDPTYRSTVKQILVPEVLGLRAGQVRAKMPQSDLPWLESYTAHVTATMTAGRLDIVGDVDDLRPLVVAADHEDADAQTAGTGNDAVTAAFAEVTLSLLSLLQAERRQPSTRPGQDRPGESSEPDPERDGPEREISPLRRLVSLARSVGGRVVRRLGVTRGGG